MQISSRFTVALHIFTCVDTFKDDDKHKKSPAALKYLRSRIQSSIDIYRRYASDLTNSSDEA